MARDPRTFISSFTGRSPRRVAACVEINQCVGCTRPCWLRRAVRNRHRQAIEQALRRWRGGRRGEERVANFDFHTGGHVREVRSGGAAAAPEAGRGAPRFGAEGERSECEVRHVDQVYDREVSLLLCLTSCGGPSCPSFSRRKASRARDAGLPRRCRPNRPAASPRGRVAGRGPELLR